MIAGDPSTADGLIDVATRLSQLSLPAGLVLAGIGLWRKAWVPGWLYRQAIEERDAAKADRDRLSQVVLGEVIPLATRQQDLLKAIEARTVSAMQDRERGS